MTYEYTVVDHGPNIGAIGFHLDTMLNNMAKKGWRLVAVAQRVGQSEAIRHYFEREAIALDKAPLSVVG